jgi:tetratricopeptide (TPR) repeat protein
MDSENRAGHHLEQAIRYFDDTDEFNKALAECDAAIEIDPSLAEAHNLRGMILEEMDEPLKAIAAYKDALEIDPEYTEAQDNLSGLRDELADDSGLVTLATYSHPLEAHIVKGRLESEGIWSFVADENMVVANWLYSNAVGGVKLQVREEDVENAQRILADGPGEIDWEEGEEGEEREIDEGDVENEPEQCPICDSHRIRYEKFAKRPLFLSWFLLGFPIPFLRGEWVCQDCEYSWKV